MYYIYVIHIDVYSLLAPRICKLYFCYKGKLSRNYFEIKSYYPYLAIIDVIIRFPNVYDSTKWAKYVPEVRKLSRFWENHSETHMLQKENFPYFN